MSQVRANNVVNANNDGPPDFPFGATGINNASTAAYADVAGIATYATTAGIATNATYATTAGIATDAQGLTGTPDIVVGNIIAVDGTFSGDVSIAGTITYQDVTDVNAVGVITATSGIDVTGRDINITSGGVNAAGVITATEYDGYLFLDNQLF